MGKKKNQQVGSKQIQRSVAGPETKRNPVLAWCQVISGPAFVIGGLALMPLYYWVGVSCTYLGLFLLTVEILFEPFLLARPQWIQLAGFAFMVFCIDYFTIAVVGSPARLDFDAYAIEVPHFEGSIFGGIQWKETQTDLRVWISNPTETNYEGLDVVVDSDAYLEGVGQLQTIPSCTVALGTEVETHATFTDANGNQHLISPPIGQTLGVGYRVICERFPAKSAVQLVIATSANRTVRRNPTFVIARGTYTAALRKRIVDRRFNVSVR